MGKSLFNILRQPRKLDLKLDFFSLHSSGFPGIEYFQERNSLSYFSEALSGVTQGEINFNVNRRAMPVSFSEIDRRLASGETDAVFYSNSLRGNLPFATQFFGALPYGLSATAKDRWLQSTTARELWSELYAPFGYEPVYVGCGADSFGQFVKSDDLSVDQLAGKTISYIDSRGSWYQQAGMRPVRVMYPYILMQRLRSASLEMTEPMLHSLNASMEVSRSGYSYWLNRWGASCSTFELLFGRKKWARFPAEAQTAIRQASLIAGKRLKADFDAREAAALQRIQMESPFAVRNAPVEVAQLFSEQAREYVENIKKANDLNRRIAQAYERYLG